MPNLYGNNCYANLTDAANAYLQNLDAGIASSPTYFRAVNLNSVSGNVATFELFTKPDNTLTNTLTTRGIFTRTFSTCTNVGQTLNDSGVTVQDAVLVSWLVVIVWAAAYYFKTLRTGVRGY